MATPAAGCPAAIQPSVLPAWARGGFTDPEPEMGYVLSDKGGIAAILFANPPTSPPQPGRSNKILWAARDAPINAPVRITATLGATSVTRILDQGIGPSTVDLPESGCWSLVLEWPGGSDTLRLRYAPP